MIETNFENDIQQNQNFFLIFEKHLTIQDKIKYENYEKYP